MSVRDHVREFHSIYGVPVLDRPQVPTQDRVRLRLQLVTEELFELLEASIANYDAKRSDSAATIRGLIAEAPLDVDIVAVADALADLDYVIEGTRLEFGIDGEPIASEVHRSNKSKLDDNGKPVRRADGKILKSSNFSEPKILKELVRQGYEP